MGLVRARRAVLAARQSDHAGSATDATAATAGRSAGWLLLLGLGASAPLDAQRVGRWPAHTWPEVRLAAGDPAPADIAAGLSVPAGAYLRVQGLIGAGLVRVDGAWPATARVEVAGRFSPDPFAQQRWAPYATAGGQLRCRPGVPCEPALLLRLGVEGPLVRGRWRPALEAGLGGGAHVAVSWRRGLYGRR
ncbi:MAG: hypothetical protein MUF53_01115 [Gemmatimonadaceae bacterium]|nr:hypothetical protein [Gemmatimonadaceae bacterium]